MNQDAGENPAGHCAGGAVNVLVETTMYSVNESQCKAGTMPPLVWEEALNKPYDGSKPDSKVLASSPSPMPAFWEIWSQHRTQLLHQCMRMMSGNIADAEDALGNALVRASTHFAEGGGAAIANKRAWLSRLVHNSCIDFFRARSRQKRWIDEVMVMSDCDFIPSVPTPEPTPEVAAEVAESMRTLQNDLNDLPELLRAPLVMRFIEGQSYSEIAERLGVPNSTVRKRVQLARERLRRNGTGLS